MQFNAAIVAVHRHGQRLDTPIAEIVLQAGDTLLVEATRAFVKYHCEDEASGPFTCTENDNYFDAIT